MRHNKSLERDFCYAGCAYSAKSPSTQALGITKYSIVTNSNDSVTLRLMTEHDLAMLCRVAKSISYRRVVGRRRSARHLLTYRNSTCRKRFSAESVTPYIAMLNGSRLGMLVVRCSWKRGRMVGRSNRSRSTRNRPVTGECITTGQRLGNQAGSSTG